MLTKPIYRLFKVFQQKEPVLDEDQAIKLNQVIGGAALIYEKIKL